MTTWTKDRITTTAPYGLLQVVSGLPPDIEPKYVVCMISRKDKDQKIFYSAPCELAEATKRLMEIVEENR